MLGKGSKLNLFLHHPVILGTGDGTMINEFIELRSLTTYVLL